MYIAVVHTVASMDWLYCTLLLCVLQRVWTGCSVHGCCVYCREYGFAVVYIVVVCIAESMDSL